MASTYQLRSLILADDARREDNGKEILIGVYSGSIVTPQIPLLLPTFALRFEMMTTKKKYDRVQVLMNGPDGNIVFRIEGSLEFGSSDFPSSFFFKVSPIQFQKEGTYTVLLGMDEEPEIVTSFAVVLQEHLGAQR
jgi:hypothetical protein